MKQKLHRRRWAHVRYQALQRDQWKCVKCQRRGRLEVDHVIPLHRGGDKYKIANLQTLCRPCHFAKTAAENRARHEENLTSHEKELVNMWRDMLESPGS